MNKNATMSSAGNKKYSNIIKLHSKLNTIDSTINFIQNANVSLRTKLKKLKHKVSQISITLDSFKLILNFKNPAQSYPNIIFHAFINYKITKTSFPIFHNFTREKWNMNHEMHV